MVLTNDAQLRVNNHNQGRKMLLRDKIAVVYGAGGGVGSAIARKFALEGAHVYLATRCLESVKNLANTLKPA